MNRHAHMLISSGILVLVAIFAVLWHGLHVLAPVTAVSLAGIFVLAWANDLQS